MFGKGPGNAGAALPTFKAKLVELRGYIRNGEPVLTGTPEKFNAPQQVPNNGMDHGGKGRHLLQLQHLGVEGAAEPGPLWSCATEAENIRTLWGTNPRETLMEP